VGNNGRNGDAPRPLYTGPCLYRNCDALSSPLHLTCPEHLSAISPATRLALIESRHLSDHADYISWLRRAVRELTENADADARDSLQTKDFRAP
jgi:hypothetical protein